MAKLPFENVYIGSPPKTKETWFLQKQINRQAKPYHSPLPYLRKEGRGRLVITGTESHKLKLNQRDVPIETIWTMNRVLSDSRFVTAHNKALSKIDGELRNIDSFFEDWYERKQAVDLLRSSAIKLLEFVKGWKNPRYWKHLKKSSRPKDIPSAWLAYQFGVKPLISGIDRAMHLLSTDFPEIRVHASSAINGLEFVDLNSVGWYFRCSTRFTYTGEGRIKFGCSVTGINPNSALNGATGLGEPFSSVWNVLPWGWAVDYFANVGQLLSNMEDRHPGISTAGWYQTTSWKASFKGGPNYEHYPSLSRPDISKLYGFSYTGHCVYMNRQVLTKPPRFQLEFKVPPLGGNKQANLFSAIALSMKGK